MPSTMPTRGFQPKVRTRYNPSVARSVSLITTQISVGVLHASQSPIVFHRTHCSPSTCLATEISGRLRLLSWATGGTNRSDEFELMDALTCLAISYVQTSKVQDIGLDHNLVVAYVRGVGVRRTIITHALVNS